jgi:4-hydroxybutyrate CoA-transferase
MRVFVHGGAATPTPLLEAIAAREDLEDVCFYHLHLQGPLPMVDPRQAGRLRSVSFFAGAAVRQAIADGRADFMPVFLSDVPRLFASGAIKLDAALVTLSAPDRHGMCSLGTSVDAARAAVDQAPLVIAEVNRRMPRTHGHTAVAMSRLAAHFESDRPLHEHEPEGEDAVIGRLGELVAGLIEDGSTLQMGIGSIPDAVLSRLHDKHDLGVHTEMFSDGLVDLAESGVLTNRCKAVHTGRSVTSFVIGTKRVFDFVDDNPAVAFYGCDHTNNTAVIRRNDRVVAINSALQVDLSGQVCADSIGHRIYSGIGGQMDFIRGAALSREGKPIMALPSTAMGGKVSRLVMELNPGAGVVTTRGHVHWVVTEYGAVNLHGRTLRERGEALVHIAHPDFRGELARALSGIRHFAVS